MLQNGFLNIKNTSFALFAVHWVLWGRSWAPLGRSWPLLGRSWLLLGRSWSLLGRSWVALWRSKTDKKGSKIDPLKKHQKNRSWVSFLAHPGPPRAPFSRTTRFSTCENRKVPRGARGNPRAKTCIFHKMCTALGPERKISTCRTFWRHGFPPDPLSIVASLPATGVNG